jgi:drug/metabolite transporter (DMT)-like permease
VLSLSLVQMTSITVVCGLVAVLPVSDAGLQLPARGADWLAVGYLGLVAGALTMALQTAAQARIEPSRAAVIMAMEPVWAAGFAVAVGGESVTARMVVGGLAILSAMYVVELTPGGMPRHGRPPARSDRPQNWCAVPARRSTSRVPVISLIRRNTRAKPRSFSRPS